LRFVNALALWFPDRYREVGVNSGLTVRSVWGLVARVWALLTLAFATPALAATCSPATSQGTAPASWQTYCWLDFTTYNDTTARSASGQTMSFTLTDGSTLTFNVKTTSVTTGTATAQTGLQSIPAPSWTGAAVGNTAFLGIPNRPVLYTLNNNTTVTLAFTNINITPPPGIGAVTAYMFVAADAESTNQTETLSFETNGSNWIVLDQVDPISGSLYPTTTNTGTLFTETGVPGTVGGYLVGSGSPPSPTPMAVTTRLVAGGLQGAMFAVRFASIRLNKSIAGVRADPADQFTFNVKSTSSGGVLGTGTTSGTGLGPFSANAVSLASGLPLTLDETMTAGSATTLAAYRTTLTCTNGTSSSTPPPNGVVTQSYSFGALQFGDAVTCNFVNTPFPRLRLSKALGGAGRVFPGDQFVMNVKQGATTLATTTTTGTVAAVSTGTTPWTQVTAAQSYSFDEAVSGTTNLSYYTPTMACTNANGSSTTPLPTAVPGTITPILGDIVTCTLTNTPKPATVTLIVTKTSTVVSDPVNGTTNPKLIPGAVVRYTISVTNTGRGVVDPATLVMTDPLPANLTFYAVVPTVTFTDGTPASGLSFSNANVTYSSQASGGAPFTATLAPDVNGYDANIKGLRIAPGTASQSLAGATAAGQPGFSVSFLARVN
jgi:uncharacterized repeat protein (TIGR01451 family)